MMSASELIAQIADKQDSLHAHDNRTSGGVQRMEAVSLIYHTGSHAAPRKEKAVHFPKFVQNAHLPGREPDRQAAKLQR
jgi:hypothetical protein